MDAFTTFLFSNKIAAHSDPLWLMVAVLGWGVGLILIGAFGKKFITKARHKALNKILKKSSGLFKAFGIAALLLYWVRMEGIAFLSMKFWWVVYGILFVWFIVAKGRYFVKLQRRIQKNS